MNNRRLTVVPADLEYFPPEHIINLLRVVAAERDELFLALQNEQAKSATAAAAAAAAAVVGPNAFTNTNADAFGFPFPGDNTTDQTTTVGTTHHLTMNLHNGGLLDNISGSNAAGVPSTFKVDAVKKRIAKKSITLVKKTAHNKAKKPYTEINEAVPNAAAAMALFDGLEPTSDTNRHTKWTLTGDQVVEWLSSSNSNGSGTKNNNNSNNKYKFIHPVKFDGKVIAFGGSKPFVYAWASYDSLQAKYDKKGASLWLKFRTKMVGSGRPKEGSNSPPSFA